MDVPSHAVYIRDESMRALQPPLENKVLLKGRCIEKVIGGCFLTCNEFLIYLKWTQICSSMKNDHNDAEYKAEWMDFFRQIGREEVGCFLLLLSPHPKSV